MNGVDITESKEEHDYLSIKAQAELILRPFTYIAQVPLPEMWKNLTKAFNHWLNVPEETLEEIENITRIHLHYNILLDDMQDNRSVRGTIPTAHCTYGIPLTINGYTYGIVSAIKGFYNIHAKGLGLYEELLKRTSIARGMEVFWNDETACPTEEEYYQVVLQKTYGLLTTKVKLMQLFSTNTQDFLKLAGMCGLYFQILDDYRSLKPKDFGEENETEEYFNAITLGRYNLPIIHALMTEPKSCRVLNNVLRLRRTDNGFKKFVVSLLDRFKSFEYTEKILAVLKEEIEKEIQKLGKNADMEKFIEEYYDSEVDTYAKYVTEDTIEGSCIFSVLENLNQIQSQNYVESFVQEVLTPLHHLQSVPGKLLRIEFSQVLNKSLKICEEKLEVIEDLIDNFHEASLLLDDIQDGSVLRRGIPVAHYVYGIVKVINTSTYMIATTIGKALQLDNAEALDIYVELTEPICRNQGLEIYWRENATCPSEAEYLEMVQGKSGVPFLLIAKLMQLFSSANRNPERFVTPFAHYFQINDDYQNLTNQVFFDSKGYCEDLTEGKFSFPIVHAINTYPEEGQIILDILQQRTLDKEIKKYCVSLITKCGSLDYTKKKLENLKITLTEEINKYGEDIAILEFLEKKMFVSYI